jgi:hypothetical protein
MIHTIETVISIIRTNNKTKEEMIDDDVITFMYDSKDERDKTIVISIESDINNEYYVNIDDLRKAINNLP